VIMHKEAEDTIIQIHFHSQFLLIISIDEMCLNRL
jgi:hypothetical protein